MYGKKTRREENKETKYLQKKVKRVFVAKIVLA